MTFGEFTEYAKENIKDFLPLRYSQAEVFINQINKTNERYTGMMVKPEGDGPTPVINLDMFYKDYLQTDDLNSVLLNMSNVIMTAVPPEINTDLMKDYEQMKDTLFVRISSAEDREIIMAESPHRVEDDLLMTYHIYIPSQDGGFMSARITNEILEGLGIDESQLHEDALANTPKIMQPKVQSMQEALMGIPEEEPSMVVITNEIGTLGAGALFCEGVMDQVRDRLHGDYYLLPSSIHEWIAVQDTGLVRIPELESMVRSANASVVEPEDRLSDNVFHYDSQERLFERADRYEARVAAMSREHNAERGSLLGRLQDKKDHIDINTPAGGEMKRQIGLAI